jgi:hypothetical protein
MSFAAQRFDSLQKPLGRIVLNLEALVRYCHLVIRDRGAGSEEGQGCLAFLHSLTEENVTLLGMMAGAADECMILTRFMDRGAFKIGSMHHELGQFHNDRIGRLFVHTDFLTCGYTQVALDFLKRPRVIQAPGQVLRTLGSNVGAESHEVLHALARTVVKSPGRSLMPSSQEMTCSKCFMCSSFLLPAAWQHGACPLPEDRASLHKITKGFNVEAAMLVAQTEEHLTIAEHEMRLGASAKARKTYQVDLLRPILQFYAIASGSTIGIERDFGSAKRNLGEQWNGSPVAEERRMLLMVARSTTPAEARARVVTAARLVWADNFGVPRVNNSNSLVKRPRRRRGDNEQPKSHAAWLPNDDPCVASVWQQRVRTAQKLQAAVEGLDADMARHAGAGRC